MQMKGKGLRLTATMLVESGIADCGYGLSCESFRSVEVCSCLDLQQLWLYAVLMGKVFYF